MPQAEETGSWTGSMGIAREIEANAPGKTAIATWLLEFPDKAPPQNYGISLIHLREVPGLAPAHKVSPNASHELQVFTLKPPATLVPSDPSTWHAEMPPFAVTQFISAEDAQARLATSLLVITLTEGWVHIESLRHRFGQTVAKITAKMMEAIEDGRVDIGSQDGFSWFMIDPPFPIL